MTSLMQGKRGIIMGVANKNSIAWGIAEELHKAGAEIIFTYGHESLEKRVKPLAESLQSPLICKCDVSDNSAIQATFADIEKNIGKIDFLVHAIAFSDKDELTGRYIDTSRENFRNTLDISCYSFTAVAKEAEAIMNDNGSMITLSYYGAEKVIQNYNVMGVAKAALEASVQYMAHDLGRERSIRVNSISAGPIKTLAAMGIGSFRKMLTANEKASALGRNVSQEEVGKTALYLLSDLASGVTGENIHVDAGAFTSGIILPDDAA